ncbi:MAG: CBS domain-containing protein, partial [Gammaproteobacteria bacterium]|nr:CBS domain-containing protein [Gammaproteobacteria bacterium]
RLLLRVSDIMRTGDRVPAVGADVTLRDALLEMTDKGLGMTAIVDDKNAVLGIYTDGDLRRTLDTGADIRTTTIREVMHTDCKTTSADVLAAEALHLLEENKITSLLVADESGTLVGALNIHDLFREGLM